MIDGVLVTPLKYIPGEDGAVMHALRKSAPGHVGFGEAYFSEVHEGVTKKWRRHFRVTMNLVVVRGQVRFVLYDDRPESLTRGEFADICIGECHYARLTVPPGLWMSFRGEGPGTSLILDIINEEHDPAEAETCDNSAIVFSW
jgi:dTDP-4-dehydrorhamnose 3,5-epimerase